MRDRFNGNTKKAQNEADKINRYRRLVMADRALSRAESFITIVCFALMCVFVIAGIVMRFILKIPNQYGEEASRYLMICGIFIGVSIGVRQKAHLGVTIVAEKLPGKLSKTVFVAAGIITTLGYLVLTFYAFRFVRMMYGFGQTSPAMNVPMYLIYSAILAGLFLSSVRSVMMFWNDYIAAEKILTQSKEESPW